MTCCVYGWCLLQAAGAEQLAAVPMLQSGPLGFTQPANLPQLHAAHAQQHQRTGSVLYPRDPQLQEILGHHQGAPPPPTHDLLSSNEAVYRKDSLGSTASTAPHTPSGCNGVSPGFSQGRPSESHELRTQALKVQVVNATAEAKSWSTVAQSREVDGAKPRAAQHAVRTSQVCCRKARHTCC